MEIQTTETQVKSEEEDRRDSRRQSLKVLISSGLVTTGIFVTYGLAVKMGIGTPEHEGQFGDMFGGINALFSGLALIGAIYAVIMQREELELQRKEMRRNWQELEEQNRILADQLSLMQKNSDREARLTEADHLPRFNWRWSNHRKLKLPANRVRYLFKNSGASVTTLSVEVNSPKGLIRAFINPSEFLHSGNSGHVEFDLPDQGGMFPEMIGSGGDATGRRGFICVFTIHYFDQRGYEGRQQFSVNLDSGTPKTVL